MLSQPVTVTMPALPAINTYVRKHFVHLISITAVLAFCFSGVADAARKPHFGPLDASGLSLFLMMLSAAIQCGFGAFGKLMRRPKSLVVCLTQFFVILPLSCWALGQLCVPLLGRELGEPIQIGLDLVILMPVAATSAIWVRDTKGDLELLVSLVVLTMSIGTMTAPLYLGFMGHLTANSIVIPKLTVLRQLCVGVLLPLVIGMTLNKLLRARLKQIQPWFTLMGSTGLFMAVFLNVGVASPLLRRLSVTQILLSVAIVLAVNLANFAFGSLVGRVSRLGREQQVTCEFSSGMRSNGTALVVGMASFPHLPLVTIPAAIYIIFQHLIASVVRSRLAARLGDGDGGGGGVVARDGVVAMPAATAPDRAAA